MVWDCVTFVNTFSDKSSTSDLSKNNPKLWFLLFIIKNKGVDLLKVGRSNSMLVTFRSVSKTIH